MRGQDGRMEHREDSGGEIYYCMNMKSWCCMGIFFFFQAEDGIRDKGM